MREFSKEELLALEASADKRNSQLGISGFLCIRETTIFQYLEGDRVPLKNLYSLIEDNPRHLIKACVYLPKKTGRVFSKRSMKVVSFSTPGGSEMSSLLDAFISKADLGSLREEDIEFILKQLLPGVAREASFVSAQQT